MAKLSLTGVYKRFGDSEVIRGIDLDVRHGEFCVFVGPSGCGKSTLLRMISGLESISDGTLTIDGERVNEVPAAERGLAMVFQSYALYPHMSVRQNLSFGLENMNTAREEIDTRIHAVSTMLQIDQLLDRRPRDLSGGQRQRVAIGRAVVREPRVFLFDEPLSNLDAELRVDMRGEIARLHKRLGNTMIYVTHDQVEAMTMADRIAVLRDGRVEQYGAPLTLYNTPDNLFVAGFIGSPRMNFFSGTLDDQTLLHASGHRIELSPSLLGADNPNQPVAGQALTLGVRPGGLRLARPGEQAIGAEVRSVERLGGDSYVYAATADGSALTLHSPGQIEIDVGMSVHLSIALDSAHLFDTNSGRRLHSGTAAAIPGISVS